jgi:CRP/FNR family transcriptional regulator, cyclic AMP receptor protein
MGTAVQQKVAAFFARYPEHTFVAGQLLVLAQEDPPAIFYLVSGKVRQYDISYRGDEVVVNVFKPQVFFPMLWAITKAPNRYFFAAETAIAVRAAPPDKVLAFLQANPDVMYDLLTRLYIGVDGLLGRMAHLMAGSAKSRVMYELLLECRRFGKVKDDGSCLIVLKEADVAARAGLSRETVSREIQKIKHDNLITTGRTGIVITDVAALEEKLGTEL